MSMCDLRQAATLRRTDVGNGAIFGPWKLQCQGLRGQNDPAHHPVEEQSERRRIGMDAVIAASKPRVLWFARAQRVGQGSPRPVSAGIETLECSADIACAAAIEIASSVLRVGVTACRISIEQTKRYEGIEKIARAAAGESKTGHKLLGPERSVRKDGEEIELDRAQQRLGFPEGIADLEDAVRRGVFHLHLRHLCGQ